MGGNRFKTYCLIATYHQMYFCQSFEVLFDGSVKEVVVCMSVLESIIVILTLSHFEP